MADPAPAPEPRVHSTGRRTASLIAPSRPAPPGLAGGRGLKAGADFHGGNTAHSGAGEATAAEVSRAWQPSDDDILPLKAVHRTPRRTFRPQRNR